MAEFSIIADISNAFLKLVRENLCPSPMQTPESIVLTSPNDKNNDFQLGIFLYDIKDLGEFRTTVPTRVGNKKQMPDRPLTLNYMLFLNTKSQMSMGTETEQRILGRLYQTIMDNPQIEVPSADPYSQEVATAGVTVINMSFDEKSKIWSVLSLPYQVAMHIQISPVMLSSRKNVEFTRVTEIEFSTKTN